MTKRKVLYAVVVGIIMFVILWYFVFLMPRDHVYNATLAGTTKSVATTVQSTFYPG